MRIIITGGGGLIGRALANSLAKAKYEVFILSRNPASVHALPNEVQVIQWDGKTAQGWAEYADGADTIVNLAGESIAGEYLFPTRWSDEKKGRIIQSRLDAGAAVVDAVQLARQKPKSVIQSSAIGYYGALKDQPVDEKSGAGTGFMAETCVHWESSTVGVEKVGVRQIIIRTGIVLTTEGGALTRLLFPFKFYAGGPMGSGRQYLSWIHIADQVGVIRFLIDNPNAQGIYNLTAPNPLTNKEFSQTIGRVMGRPAFLPVPGFALRMMFGEVATVVLDGQRVLPTRLHKAGYEFQFPTAEEALQNLIGK